MNQPRLFPVADGPAVIIPLFRRFAPVCSSSPTRTAAVVVGDPRSGTPPTSLTAPSTHSKGKQ